MGHPIAAWNQIPPEHRERVKAELQRTAPPNERRFVRMSVAYFAACMVLCAIIWILTGREAAWVVFFIVWAIGMVINARRQSALAKRDAERFADALRAVGLEPAEPAAPQTWRHRWQQFAPPAKGQIDRDWSWVRQRSQRVKQRIGPALMWRYREEMYRRRFRYLLPGMAVILMLSYLPLTLLNISFGGGGTNTGPFTLQLFSATLYILPFALIGLLLIAWIAFYFIHESWRPTWAALNSLGAPTCMRCGYDLTHHEQQPCPECNAQPGEEVVWSEPAVQPMPTHHAMPPSQIPPR